MLFSCVFPFLCAPHSRSHICPPLCKYSINTLSSCFWVLVLFVAVISLFLLSIFEHFAVQSEKGDYDTDKMLAKILVVTRFILEIEGSFWQKYKILLMP